MESVKIMKRFRDSHLSILKRNLMAVNLLKTFVEHEEGF